jgi:adenine-specific DNA-methyltransferase
MDRAESATRIGLHTREIVIPSRDTNAIDLFVASSRQGHDLHSNKMNRLIYGDNLLAMAALLAGSEDSPSLRSKVDLIYIDPPYDSKADYRTKIKLESGSIEQLPNTIEQFAYSDTWASGTSSYIEMITPRLVLLKELLADDGDIFVHIDWHVGHYIKIVMDEIFGKDNFRNEIVWHYYNKIQGNINRFASNHDVIFSYKKTENPFFETQRELRDKPKQQQKRAWDPETKSLKQARDEEGKLLYYEDTHRTIDDVWRIPYIMPADKKQKLDFETQKPESLLERIILSSSRPNALVADFFGGSGTTAAVADKLGRRWIICDMGKPACMIMRKRLIDQDAKPFLFEHIGDYQVEQLRSTMGRRFRIGDLAEIVLGLYGALPLAPEDNPNRNMGRLPNSKTLILADSPNKMTGVATLRRAIDIRDNLMGGWDKVVVLGWNFDSAIGHDIEGLGQGDRLEVLVIPPDLLDRLKKKGHKLKADEVRFSSLQYVKLKGVRRDRTSDSEVLTVELDNYVLLSPDALNIDESNRERLQKFINDDPLALIEYWSVDPDYDGEVFRSVWQDYRGNTENDDDPYRVVTRAQLTGLPPKAGARLVCVRVVDVFGFEAEAVVEVS